MHEPKIREFKPKRYKRVKGPKDRVVKCIRNLFCDSIEELTNQLEIDDVESKRKKLSKRKCQMESLRQFETYNPYNVLRENPGEQIDDINSRLKINKTNKALLKKCRYCNYKKMTSS